MYAVITALVLLAAALLIYLAAVFYRKAKLNAVSAMEYDREISTDGIFAGETLELTETVCNTGWFPIFGVKMEFYVPAGITVDGIVCNEYTKLTSVFNVPPYATVQKKHTVRADKRGRFYLPDAKFSYRKTDFIFDIPIQFYGYPDYFDAKTDMPADVCRAGNAIADRKYLEDPFFISGIREYRVGDPMRSINFKASGRSFSGGTRSLMSNCYDSSRSYDTMIFLDMNSYAEVPFQTGIQLENGLKYACFLFCEAVKNGGRVGFSSNCAEGEQKFFFIGCDSGEAHIKRILEQFAVIDLAKRNYSMAALLQNHALRLKSGTDIYLITPFVDENTAKMLLSLERSGLNVHTVQLNPGGRL